MGFWEQDNKKGILKLRSYKVMNPLPMIPKDSPPPTLQKPTHDSPHNRHLQKSFKKKWQVSQNPFEEIRKKFHHIPDCGNVCMCVRVRKSDKICMSPLSGGVVFSMADFNYR